MKDKAQTMISLCLLFLSVHKFRLSTEEARRRQKLPFRARIKVPTRVSQSIFTMGSPTTLHLVDQCGRAEGHSDGKIELLYGAAAKYQYDMFSCEFFAWVAKTLLGCSRPCTVYAGSNW